MCFFLIAMVFKVAELSDSIAGELSGTYLQRFVIDEDMLALFLFVVLLGSLAVFGLLAVFEIRAERRRRLYEERAAKARRLRCVADASEVILGLPVIPDSALTGFAPTYVMGSVSGLFHLFLSQ